MSRQFKAYPSAFTGQRPHYSELELGEVATYSVNWNGVINDLGTSASSSTWTTEQSAITKASPALSSGVASVVVTAANIGESILSDSLTMADGSKREQKFAIRVIDTR